MSISRSVDLPQDASITAWYLTNMVMGGWSVTMNAFAGFVGSKLGLAVTLVAAALGVYLLATHTGHALAAAPYLLLLACPLMHFFGHHHRSHRPETNQSAEPH
jgi:hypothetical protein